MASDEATVVLLQPMEINDEFSQIGEALCSLISTLSLQSTLEITTTMLDAASFSWKGVLLVIRGLLAFRDFATEISTLVDSRLAAAFDKHDLKSLAITLCLARQLSAFQIAQFPGHEQWFHSRFVDEVSIA